MLCSGLHACFLHSPPPSTARPCVTLLMHRCTFARCKARQASSNSVCIIAATAYPGVRALEQQQAYDLLVAGRRRPVQHRPAELHVPGGHQHRSVRRLHSNSSDTLLARTRNTVHIHWAVMGTTARKVWLASVDTVLYTMSWQIEKLRSWQHRSKQTVACAREMGGYLCEQRRHHRPVAGQDRLDDGRVQELGGHCAGTGKIMPKAAARRVGSQH